MLSCYLSSSSAMLAKLHKVVEGTIALNAWRKYASRLTRNEK